MLENLQSPRIYPVEAVSRALIKNKKIIYKLKKKEKKMTNLTAEQIEEGKKVLEGPKIYFWVLSVIAGIGILTQNSFDLLSKGINFGPVSIGFPASNSVWIFAALYVASLVGIYMRKSWAVPVGRAGLIVSMVVLFPVGTIFGAILWKRFKDPAAKRYLDYKVDEPVAAATGAATPPTATEPPVEKITVTAEEKDQPKP
jgi:hypothetical protein